MSIIKSMSQLRSTSYEAILSEELLILCARFAFEESNHEKAECFTLQFQSLPEFVCIRRLSGAELN